MKTLYERISPYLSKTSRAAVMKAWDKAIKLAKEDEK